MKITALKTFVVPTTGNFFVKVETDEGIYGLGEAGLKRRGNRDSRSNPFVFPRCYRARPLSDRALVAGHVSRRIFPGRRGTVIGSERRGYRALGHQRQSPGRTRL